MASVASKGNGSGQRKGCKPRCTAVRSTRATAMSRSSQQRNASQLSWPGSSAASTGLHSTPGHTCSARSAARYASGEPRSKKKAGVPSLAVDEPAIGGPCGLHDGLAERRVAVAHAPDLGVAALEQLDVDELLDELGRLRPDDVAAQQLAVLLVAHDLDQAGAVAVDGAGADGAVLDLADHDVVAGLARLRLGQSERCDVGRAEGRAGHVDVLDRVGLQAGGVLDGDAALVGGLVRQRGAVHEVADRPHALEARALLAVDVDEAARVELDAGLLEPEALDVGPAAGGDDQPVGLALLVAVGERHRAVARLHVLDERLGVDLDALLLEAALGELGDVGVLGGQHALERLEELDLEAEAFSAPDAPAPTTTIVFGSAGSAHASSVPITRPPNCVPGIGFFTEPVARMTAFATSISSPSKLEPTFTLPSAVTEP